MSKSGEAFEKLTYEEIRSMTLKEVGEWLTHQRTDLFESVFKTYFTYRIGHNAIEALKCGVMPE